MSAFGGEADIATRLPRLCESAVRKPDTLERNSLLRLRNSLFFEKFSLLICVGNCAKSRCSTAVPRHQIGLGSLKIVKFPVKFPVSREFEWRRALSALRRQPGNVRFRAFPSSDEKGPPNVGSSPIVSGDRCSNFSGREFPKVSSRIQENSRFPETPLEDPRINPLSGRRGSALNGAHITFLPLSKTISLGRAAQEDFSDTVQGADVPAPLIPVANGSERKSRS
jgi:hypothetical protein